MFILDFKSVCTTIDTTTGFTEHGSLTPLFTIDLKHSA